MKYTFPLIIFVSLTLPLCALAANVDTDLTPAQVEEQQWDTECRATLAPYGQGDLEAALLYKLRQCINEKRTAKRIETEHAKELERLSQRDQREASRRAVTVSRLRSGAQQRIESAASRRTDQGTLLERLKIPGRYQKIHRTLRGVEVPSATSR